MFNIKKKIRIKLIKVGILILLYKLDKIINIIRENEFLTY